MMRLYHTTGTKVLLNGNDRESLVSMNRFAATHAKPGRLSRYFEKYRRRAPHRTAAKDSRFSVSSPHAEFPVHLRQKQNP